MSTPTSFTSDRKEASRVASLAEFQDIRLMRTKVELERLPDTERMTYFLDTKVSVDYDDEEQDDWFIVEISYDLTISEHGGGEAAESTESSDRTVASLQFEFASLYSLDLRGGNKPGEEELRAFAVTTGQFATHPFAREFIRDMTGRLALPPLTIGLLHQLLRESDAKS